MEFRRRRIQAGDLLRRTFAPGEGLAPGFLVRQRFVTGAFCVSLIFVTSGCGENEKAGTGSSPEKGVAKSADILFFPQEMRVKDDSANRFLARAMKVCADGQYEPFRLLWSVKETPLPRGDFQKGWQAVQEIRIRAFQEVFLAREGGGEQPAGETVYVVLADVHLDPTQRAGEREPDREVALMLVREKDEWRLAKAPAKMRKWLKDRMEKAAATDAQRGANRRSGDIPDHRGVSGTKNQKP